MNYLILMLMLILGFVLGFILGFVVLIYQFKFDLKIKPIKKQENEKPKKIKNKGNNQDNKDVKKENSFKNRMLDMEDSWSDMNCTLDNVSKEKYIEENRGKQDKAYNYKK